MLVCDIFHFFYFLRTCNNTTAGFFCFTKFLTGRADSAVERKREGEEGAEPEPELMGMYNFCYILSLCKECFLFCRGSCSYACLTGCQVAVGGEEERAVKLGLKKREAVGLVAVVPAVVIMIARIIIGVCGYLLRFLFVLIYKHLVS